MVFLPFKFKQQNTRCIFHFNGDTARTLNLDLIFHLASFKIGLLDRFQLHLDNF